MPGLRTPDVGARTLANLRRVVAAICVATLSVACSHTAKPNVVPGAIVVRSRDFETGGAIPARFTCDGENVSPSLIWSNLPPGTHSVDLVMTDPDAHGFVHWRIDGIPADVNAVAAGGHPPGAVRNNGFGSSGYRGPCPPSRHRYTIEVRAFAGVGGTGTQLGSGVLQATYERGVSVSPSP